MKLWRLMGSWWRKEEEEGGEVVVVIVGMEERMVEELVELVVEKREKVAGHGKGKGLFLGAAIRSLLVGRRRRKIIMKERERRRCLYKGI